MADDEVRYVSSPNKSFHFKVQIQLDKHLIYHIFFFSTVLRSAIELIVQLFDVISVQCSLCVFVAKQSSIQGELHINFSVNNLMEFLALATKF